MTMMQIKNRWSGEVIYQGEAETLRDLVGMSVKSRANLSRADLSGADLCGANLSRADLSGADLSRADLYGANLSGANLSRADLSRADLSGQHMFSFSGIGSARRSTTYWVEADKIWCGCFTGTLSEFIQQVRDTYSEGHRHRLEYEAGIVFLQACVAAIPAEDAEAGRKAYSEMGEKSKEKAVAA